MNKESIFSNIRSTFYPKGMSQSVVSGIEAILDAFVSAGLSDNRWLAYMLGTAYHETGTKMFPVREAGGNAYLTRRYDVKGERPEVAKKFGNINPGDGIKFSGRGFVQLTWRVNYKNMGHLIGVDLENNPDLALDPKIAAKIMIEGMTKGHSLRGDFTGVSLENYFNDQKSDWINARKIINGLDCAEKIADHSRKFFSCISN